MPNDNINVTMASAYIVGPPIMSSATVRCEVLSINPTVHILRRFLDNRKMTKSGCSRSHVVGRFPLPNFSVLLQLSYAIRTFYFASKSLFWV